jgi:hypothetical protein
MSELRHKSTADRPHTMYRLLSDSCSLEVSIVRGHRIVRWGKSKSEGRQKQAAEAEPERMGIDRRESTI